MQTSRAPTICGRGPPATLTRTASSTARVRLLRRGLGYVGEEQRVAPGASVEAYLRAGNTVQSIGDPEPAYRVQGPAPPVDACNRSARGRAGQRGRGTDHPRTLAVRSFRNRCSRPGTRAPPGPFSGMAAAVPTLSLRQAPSQMPPKVLGLLACGLRRCRYRFPVCAVTHAGAITDRTDCGVMGCAQVRFQK